MDSTLEPRLGCVDRDPPPWAAKYKRQSAGRCHHAHAAAVLVPPHRTIREPHQLCRGRRCDGLGPGDDQTFLDAVNSRHEHTTYNPILSPVLFDGDGAEQATT